MFLCHLGESWRFSFYRLEKILLDVVQSVSHVCLCVPPGLEHARLHFTIPFTISQSLLKLISIELMKLSSHLVLSRPSLLLSSIFPTSGSFAVIWLIASGGQSIGASASASVLPMNSQYKFPLGLTGLIFLLSKGHSRVFSCTTVQKHQFFNAQPALWFNIHIHVWLLRKP